MKKILRYTDKLASLVGSHTKAEPWLHIGIVITDNVAKWAVWIWDTRVIVDYGDIHQAKNKKAMTMFAEQLHNGEPAIDNHKPLLDMHGDDKHYPIELSIAFGFCKTEQDYKARLPKKRGDSIRSGLGRKRRVSKS